MPACSGACGGVSEPKLRWLDGVRNESSENGEIEEKEWKHRARKHVKRTGLGSAKPLVPSPHSSVRLQVSPKFFEGRYMLFISSVFL